MLIEPHHLIEARAYASRASRRQPAPPVPPKTPPPDNVIPFIAEVEIDMDITEIIPPARLAALQAASKGYK